MYIKIGNSYLSSLSIEYLTEPPALYQKQGRSVLGESCKPGSLQRASLIYKPAQLQIPNIWDEQFAKDDIKTSE